MNIAKIGFGLSVSAALCLMACGDDESSGIGPQDNQNELTSSSSEGNSAPESSSEVANSSSSVEATSSSSVEEAAPCAFAATDNVWEMTYKADDGKGSGTVKTIYEIDGEDLVIRDSIRYTGTQASMFCRLSDGPAEMSSRDGKLTGVHSCDGGSAALVVTTVREKGYFAANAREAVHAAVQKACGVAVNGGTYEAVPLATKTTCDFKAEDAVWAYTYLDKDWRDKDSVIVHQSFIFENDDRVKAEQHPMQHVECVVKHLTEISSNNYCAAEGLMDVSASGLMGEKESIYESELSACKAKMPAEVEPESSSSTEGGETSSSSEGTASSSSVTTPAGDMVSCDIPGVFGECIEYPAGSDEAIAMTAQCESVLEGTLGTGCAN